MPTPLCLEKVQVHRSYCDVNMLFGPHLQTYKGEKIQSLQCLKLSLEKSSNHDMVKIISGILFFIDSKLKNNISVPGGIFLIMQHIEF